VDAYAPASRIQGANGKPIRILVFVGLVPNCLLSLQAVSDLAMQLYISHLLGTPAVEFTESSRRAWHKAHPYAVINSTIMVAIKLLYGLGRDGDDQQEQQELQQQQDLLDAFGSTSPHEQQEVLLQRLQQLVEQQQREQGHQQQPGSSSVSPLWYTWAHKMLERLQHLGFAFASTSEVKRQLPGGNLHVNPLLRVGM
jgi:hypothetical protein